MQVSATAGTQTAVYSGIPDCFKIEPDAGLEQGDLIPRSAEVIDVTLRKYHPYHVAKPANEMFAVLTQSCDLVRHEGRCKTRYIALAPVRPLRLVLDREFRDYLVRTPGELFVLGSAETRGRYEEFLAKLINNNDSRHFFIPQRPDLQIAEDMCVMLPLAMSIRAEHYDACRDARVAQISDLFQAKLGWLLGQQFSRVGTPDWQPTQLSEKVQSVSSRNLSWFPEHELSQLKAMLREFARNNPGVDVDEAALGVMQRNLRNRRDLAISAILDVLVKFGKLGPLPNPEAFALRKELRRDSAFASFFPTP